jgi:hypothetical protein
LNAFFGNDEAKAWKTKDLKKEIKEAFEPDEAVHFEVFKTPIQNHAEVEFGTYSSSCDK